MAFYNITSTTSTGGLVFIKITECDGSGTDLGATGGSSSINYTGIRYFPRGEDGSGSPLFRLYSPCGEKSIPLTKDNLKKIDGVAVGVKSTYTLHNEVELAIKS